MGCLTIKLAVLLLCLGYAKNSKLDSASSKLVFRNNDGCSGLQPVGSSHCNWYYLAYAPRKLRAGSTEKVLVITHNVKFDVTVSIKVVGTRHGEIAAADGVVKPGVLTEIPVKIPQNVPTSCTIKVHGSAEVPAGTDGILQDAIWDFQNETGSIRIERTSTSVFVQTDRPIYKPGETMRMRVVAVDSNLKAAKGVASRVSVLNPTRSLMRQWKEVKLRNGIASFKLKLSIKPVLGTWKVQATVNGVTKAVKVKVEKYVLPKFQVTVNPPPYIAFGQHKVYAEVCAKYSYGKKVNGFMTAEICAKLPGYYRSKWHPAKDYCTLVMRQIYGCEQVEIDLKEYKIYDYSGWGSIRFSMAASVKETATGISLNATKKESTVSTTQVSLSFDQSTPKIFKPGLPFEAGLSASHPDGSSVSGIFVKVTVTVGWSKKLFNKMVKIINGMAKIKLPEIPFDAKEVRFSASYERPKVPGSKLRDYKRRSSAYLASKAWYSPSHSYMSIDKPNKVFKVGQKASVKVRYTSVDSSPVKRTVYYTLMCKGYAAHSGSVETEFIAATSRQKRSIIDFPPDDEDAPTTVQVTTAPQPEGVNGTDTKTSEPEPITAQTAEPETTTTTPPPTTVPWWERRFEMVTRPPLPKLFSASSFNIDFKVTQEMSPSCRLLVYYIRHRETIADSTTVDVASTFANEVSMEFNEEEVFPGSNVKLTLKASPGSVFAIAAVDKSVHFLADANDIKTNQVTEILKNLDIGPVYINDRERCGSSRYWWYPRNDDYVDSQKAFNDNGMAFLTNLLVDTRPCDAGPSMAVPLLVADDYDSRDYSMVPVAIRTGSEGQPGAVGGKKPVKKKAAPKPKVRSEFPETWLWTEERIDSKTGEKVVDVKVPDTITTWYASGFAISEQDGLGVANPAEVRGFKAVFVSVNLPYAVTRGELVTIPVVAFNYLSTCLNVRISMKKSKDFDLITRGYANTCICGGRTATVMFKFYAKTLGRIELEATAQSQEKNNCPSFVQFDSNTYIDIVRKKLLVEPEGIEKEYTYNSLVCPKGKDVAEKANLAIPDKVVEGSVYSELRVIGDLMGPSLSNIDSLLKMPYGCGEQNMLNFAPNIFIMQYLKATNQLTSDIEEKATGYTLQGYQRELSYKHSDGSYSAFGESDKEGSMWLTAFVLKSLAQAREFIDIDKTVLGDAKRWILNKQTRDGCFPTIGTLHSKSMKGGVDSPVTLTAYVVIALLEADVKPESPSIKNAIKKCIKPELSKVNDTYSLNILAYAMAKAGRQKEFTYLITKLDSLATKKDGTRYWGSPKPEPKKRDGWFYMPYYQAKSDDIEQTAYGLLARTTKTSNSAIESVDIVRWLSQQRNSLGGWASTQDTVLAMQALAEFAAMVYGGALDLTIDAAVPGMSHRFTVNNDNSLVLQRVKIPSKFPATLKTFAKGNGCALMSASVKYNVKTVQEEPAFNLEVNLAYLKGKKKLSFGRCLSQEIDICATWLKEDTSNMAIISVKMLSGFEPILETLDKAVKRDPLLKEYEKKGKEYVFYYSRIGKKGVCLRFKMKQAQIVENIKPSFVKVYDYYDKDMSATKTYGVTPEMCVGIPTAEP